MPKKLDTDQTATQRALNIFCYLLFSGRKVSLSQLSKQFNCSKPTIMRTIDAIESSHVAHITAEIDGGQRWYQLADLPCKYGFNLSEREIEALSLGRDLLTRILPKDLESTINDVIFKISTLLAQPEKRASATEKLAIQPSWGQLQTKEYKKHLECLLSCIDEKRICAIIVNEEEHRFDYTAPQKHEFLPMRLMAENDVLYMEGWKITGKTSQEVAYPLTVPLHRIIECTSLRITLKNCPELPEYAGAFGIVGYEKFLVKIIFEKSFKNYIMERFWSKDQVITLLPDDRIELTFYASEHYALMRWILSFGTQATLIEPEDVKDMLVEEIAVLYEEYDCDSYEFEDDEN